MGVKMLAPFALLLVAACGYKGSLSRIDPAGMEREELREARAEERDEVAQALAPVATHRPVRVDDISIRLEERADDPFDLPPE